jgi:hypothetical protein
MGVSAKGYTVTVVVPEPVVTDFCAGVRSGNTFVFTARLPASNTVTCGIMHPAGAATFESGQIGGGGFVLEKHASPGLQVAVPLT